METVVLIVGLVGAVAAAFLTPLNGVVLYLGLLCWRVPGVVQVVGLHFTAPRMVIPVVFIRCVADPALRRRFRWCAADVAVILLFVGQLTAGLATSPADGVLQNRAGVFFDIALAYFAVRFVLVTRESVVRLMQRLVVVAAPMGALGVLQSVTGMDPLGRLFGMTGERSVRHGLFRAAVTSGSSIIFGFLLGAIFVAGLGAWRSTGRRFRPLVSVALALVGLGALSAMSSGPIMALGTSALVLLFWPFRRHWRMGLVGLVAMFVALEVASNSPWYQVIYSRFAYDASTAAYRVELITEAFGGGMTGHWLTGYGLITGENFSYLVPHWQHTDVCNHYIFELMRFGLCGLIPLVGALALPIRQLRRGYRRCGSDDCRWLVWCVGAAVVGAMSSMMSANWEDQAYSLLFVVLGMGASMPTALLAPAMNGERSLAVGAAPVRLPCGAPAFVTPGEGVAI